MTLDLESIKALVANEFEQFKQIILNNVNSNAELANEVSSHILKTGGKHIRPLMLLLTAKACGYHGQQHIYPAVAIEYFHTATLLHDDVLDESSLRRGNKTANSIWGSKASILVGNILLTQSVRYMTKSDSLAMLKVLIDTAQNIISGEVQQLSNAHSEQLSIADYFEVIRAKTALLFSAATQIGAMAAQAHDDVIQNLQAYGLHLGNAFQIIDDILDYSTNSQTMGKQPGDDLRDGKITLPLIYAMEAASNTELKLIQDSIQQGSDQHIDNILEIMYKSNAFEKSRNVAKIEADKAITSLCCLPESPYKDALMTLVNFTLDRNH